MRTPHRSHPLQPHVRGLLIASALAAIPSAPLPWEAPIEFGIPTCNLAHRSAVPSTSKGGILPADLELVRVRQTKLASAMRTPNSIQQISGMTTRGHLADGLS